MRKTLCSLALSGVLAVAGSAAFAQTDSSAQQPSTTQSAPAMANPQVTGRHAMNPDQQAAHLAKKLSLSADQTAQIKPILADRQQQMETVRQDQSMNRKDKMAKIKSLRDDSNTKIEAVLTDTQKQTFAQMQAKEQQRHQTRKPQGTDAAPANSPS